MRPEGKNTPENSPDEDEERDLWYGPCDVEWYNIVESVI